MIACAGPSFSSVNHTINTLRYADRLKEKPTSFAPLQFQNHVGKGGNNNINNNPVKNVNNNNNNMNNNFK